MEKELYEITYNMEDNYWWFVGLRELILSFKEKSSHKRTGLRILDAGCGTGGLLDRLRSNRAYGIDISEEAIKFCKSRKINNVIRASVSSIPFSRDFFDLIISLDVLYHSWVKNDIAVLKEFYRVLDRDGILLLNLPAYDFLRSQHDKAIHTRHRYTHKELKRKVKKAFFKIEKITYRNSLLFPLMVIIRFLEKIFSKNKKIARLNLRPLPSLINKFLIYLLFLENWLILSGLNFPFGLSLFCVARKK